MRGIQLCGVRRDLERRRSRQQVTRTAATTTMMRLEMMRTTTTMMMIGEKSDSFRSCCCDRVTESYYQRIIGVRFVVVDIIITHVSVVILTCHHRSSY